MAEKICIVLRVEINEGRNLAAKDKSGTSDPFVIVRLGSQKKRTEVIRRDLNPRWDAQFDFSVDASSFPLSVQLICYDKDRITKEYIGETTISTGMLVSGEKPKFWASSQQEILQLVDRKNKKNKVENPGVLSVKYGFYTLELDDATIFKAHKPIWDVLGQYSSTVYKRFYLESGLPLPDSNRSSPSPTRGLGKPEHQPLVHQFPGEAAMEQLLGPILPDSGALSDGNLSDSGNEATLFGIDEKNPLLGVIVIDIVSSSDLPYDKNLTRTSFDMDPFVVITHGRQTFKTRFLRHTLNPVWNERLYFHVRQSYLSHVVKFSVYDHDKFSNNDFIGSYTVTVQELLDLQAQGGENPNMSTRDQIIPLALAKDKWRESFKSTMTIRANFRAAEELRGAFLLALVKEYDTDNNGAMNHKEILSLLEYLQAIAPEKLVDRFFRGCGKSPDTEELSFQEFLPVLETYIKEGNSGSTSDLSGSSKSSDSEGEIEMARHRIFYIDRCPLCHKVDLSWMGDTEIITHVAICSMKDPSVQIDRLMTGDFVTEAYAQRKWFTRAMNRLGYGRYSVGRNNANIIVQDRTTGQLIEEKIPVYIRLGIRLLYKNIASKSAVDTRAIRHLLKSTSLKQGRKFDDPASVRNIRPFIQFHQINEEEILEPIESFKNFNEFFYRKIKPDSRTLASPNPKVAVSPADCRCTCFPTINEATQLWIKGEHFSVARLLGETAAEGQLAQAFDGGSLAIFRLAPQDYHRFHFPVDGRVRPPQPIDGQYFTVNPMAIRSPLDVYGENKRIVSVIESEQFGLVAYVSIGAMMVGSIVLTCEPMQQYSRMDEFGYFAFGGSTIVLLFQKGMIKFDEDLVENSRRSLETLIRMGSSIGTKPGTL
ncbi:hypothetical protein K493DRAFT_91114 [Basidiobolus meristosporus CBS 931.73]|uniref:Phosphatidylserine decarboxylase proenzyme 2 n=1 Tax=Basidiobolus meristosporus CBS 931.73 TaxID=1314790 RepID=A0A1Y1XBE1_9FUNG|nr:hypothetical protein K493DRAFT_91114 [Basidiobolus meristosporus CBS 931.73]|eukprot:ORX82756.1 hypothetical protein K493DRAFT_91114 [Basidiobolus meristosporus CBS 931.73]